MANWIHSVTRASSLRSPARLLFGFDVFISYARSDGTTYAEFLEAKLEGAGFTVFRDKRELNAGDPLSQAIVKAIRRSKRFALVDTVGARNSDWVAKEVETFLQFRKQGLIQIR